MEQHKISLPVAVAIAVVALVLGSFGTAAASGLTKGKVKQLAAKVVVKKAPGLSVAHADSATTASTASNSATLAGQPPSSYQTPSYSYVVPTGADANLKIWTFPGLPAGTYAASYTVLASLPGGGQMYCNLYNSATSTLNEAFAYGVFAGPVVGTVAASAPLVVGNTSPRLECGGTAAGTNFHIFSDPNYVSRVTFVKVDSLGGGTAARSASEARSAAGGPKG